MKKQITFNNLNRDKGLISVRAISQGIEKVLKYLENYLAVSYKMFVKNLQTVFSVLLGKCPGLDRNFRPKFVCCLLTEIFGLDFSKIIGFDFKIFNIRVFFCEISTIFISWKVLSSTD